jgi:hypothetical protein
MVVYTTTREIDAAGPHDGVMMEDWAYRSRGLQYAGFTVGTISPVYPTAQGAIGLWLSYGIY